MREILFRGKRVDNGEWVVSDSFYQCNGIIKLWDEPNRDGYVEVIPKTVGQYTGLKDKIGKKIFEGDIVLFEDESPLNYEYHDCTEMRCGEIKFDDGQFYITNRIAVYMEDLIYSDTMDCKVIGNIHDNPELL